MRQLIAGVWYDTSKARALAVYLYPCFRDVRSMFVEETLHVSSVNSFWWWVRDLVGRPSFFICNRTYENKDEFTNVNPSSEYIAPLDVSEAKGWLEKHEFFDIYEELFGKIKEF